MALASCANFQPNPARHDFGDVVIGTSSAPQQFVWKNTGKNALVPVTASTTDTLHFPITTALANLNPIAVNAASPPVGVTFSPDAEGSDGADIDIGPNSDAVEVRGNGVGSIITVNGFLIDGLAQGDAVDFGTVRVGTVTTRRFSFRNMTAAPITLTLNQSPAAPLSANIPGLGGGTFTIPANGRVKCTATYSPGAAGTHLDHLRITGTGTSIHVALKGKAVVGGG